ncbi:MAG: S-layer homology domain-containing protein [Clostridiales bacterium]|nr:S-layer homology domain-containing protein [Clostridiales bacterium]
MKYKIGDGEWTPISSNDAVSLTELSACTISIMRSDGQKLYSETQTISVTKPNAPRASAQNCINGNDGKLTGVNNTMEYRRTDTTTWTAVTGSEVTGLAAGSYEVRCKANGAALASEPQTVTIGSYAAQLTKSNGGVSYYASLKEAVDAAKNNSGSIVKLLQNIKVEAYSLGIEGCKNPFTIDLNGKTLSTDISDEIPGNLVFYLKNNDAPLTLINSASTQAVIQSQRAFHIQFSGSVIIGKPDGSDSNIKFELSTMLATGSENTGSITIYGGTFGCPVNVSTTANAGVSKVTLYGGIFSEIGVAAPATLVGTLAEGYGFQKDNAWVNQLDGTELTGVTVQQAPIEAFTLTADKTTADYGEEITLTASARLRDEEKTAAYQWFKDGKPVNTTESSYGIAALTAGDHTITCTVSCDGYSTSKNVDLKVNKVDSQITPPAAMENLVYTGKEQALITAGTAIGGTMQYCLTQDGTYSKNVPTSKNAGSYTVWYKVAGDGNHSDTTPASVSVTIAKVKVEIPAADPTQFTYSGEEKTYTLAASGLYTVAGNVWKNAGTYTVTVTLEDTANYVWSDNTDAAKEYTFIIGKAQVTVTAKDKSAYVGSTAPDLSKPGLDKDYTVSGLIGEDKLTTAPTLVYDPAPPDMTRTGDAAMIVASGASAGENYEITYVDGKLTLSVRPITSPTTTKTETTTNPDGSVTKTETKSDGTVTETTTNKDGSTTKTETKPDGSSKTEVKDASGSTGTVKTDKNGQTEAAAKVSGKAVEDAKKNGEAVKVPVEVETTRNPNTAPTVKVELPKNAGETEVEIPVSNVKPGTVAVLVHPDGTEELMKDSIPTENGIRLTMDGSATVKIIDNSKDFIDTRNHWAKDAIDFVSARGLVNGTSDTIYAPNNSTTRAQLWTILARQNDADLNGGATWFENAQNWAKDKGVSDGANPNAAINRAQMVTMLWRAIGQPAAGSTANFIDVPADAYYAGAVFWAVENGITTGVGGGRFDPTAACTRAQIAAFLARSMK